MAPREVIKKLRLVVKELFKRTEVQDLINNVSDVESCMNFLIDEDSLMQYADTLKALRKDAAAAFKLFSRIRGKSKTTEEVKCVFEEEFEKQFPGYDSETGNPNIHITIKPQAAEPPNKKRVRNEEEETGSRSARSSKKNDADERAEKEAMKGVIRQIVKRPDAEVFLHPVSAEAFPDYYQLIKEPRDLTSAMEGALKVPLEETLSSVRLVWDNCKTYNAEGSDIYETADKLSAYFEEQVAAKLGAEYTRTFSLTLTLPVVQRSAPRVKEELLLQDPKEAKRIMQHILGELKKSEFVEPFLDPVNEAEAPGYSKYVSRSMDISTVERTLSKGNYGGDLGKFRDHMNLIWENCFSYNDDGSEIYRFALRLQAQFLELFSQVDTHNVSTGVRDVGSKERRARMKSILDVLRRSSLSEPFRLPVDLGEAPGYAELIATPMDLSTVAARIDSYASLQDFAADVRLIFSNCEQYNIEGSQLVLTAKACLRLFEEELRSLPDKDKEKDKSPEDAKDKRRPREKEEKEKEVKEVKEEAKEPEPEKAPPVVRARPSQAVKIQPDEIWSVEDDSTNFRVGKLTEDNLDELLIQLQAPEAPTSFFIRGRAHKRAREILSRVMDFNNLVYPIQLSRSDVDVLDIGELPLQAADKRRPSGVPAPVLPAFYTPQILFPLGYTSETTLRLAVLASDDADGQSAPHIITKFCSRIKSQGAGDQRQPLFEVSCENTLVAAASSPRVAWERAVLTLADGRLFKVLGGRLKRCRAVLNRLCASQHVVPFLEQVDPDSAEGQNYYLVVRAPMWLREIHRRLVAGTYDWEFDFAWDMRLVFQNCMTYNLSGSELYVTAEKLLSFFEELLCQWVLNVQDASVDDPAKGDWDDWDYLKYFDEPAGLDDHFCALSKARLPEGQLIMCTACDDEYEMRAINILRPTSSFVKSWTCQRCIKARDFSFLCLDPPSQSISQYNPYSVLNFGQPVFIPAPQVGPGWFQARHRDSNEMAHTYLSPLGERLSGENLLRAQKVHEYHQNTKLLKDREKEFFRNDELILSVKRLKKETVLPKVEAPKLTCGALYGLDLAPGAKVRILVPNKESLQFEPILDSDAVTGGSERLLRATGFFGLEDADIVSILEGAPSALYCAGYVFSAAADEQKRASAECKAEKTRRRTRGAQEVRSVKGIARERWKWEIYLIEHSYFHHFPHEEEEGAMDVDAYPEEEEEKKEEGREGETTNVDGDPYDYTKHLQPLLPPGMTGAEGDTLLALWDMLYTCGSSIGDLPFTFADLVRCADPPPSKSHSSLGQIIFDEVCTSLTHLLLADLRRSCCSRHSSHNETMWETVYMTKPLNIISWPHILLTTLHARDRSLSEKSVLSALLYGPSTDDIGRRNLLFVMNRHPDIIEACLHSRPFKDRLAAVKNRAYFDPEEEEVEGDIGPYTSVAEMVLQVQEALEELANRDAPAQLDNALNGLQWLGAVCRGMGVEGMNIESKGGRLSEEPTASLVKGSERARALELFLDERFAIPATINPFDFGNKTALTLAGMELGDARKELERRGAVAELESISHMLRLLSSSDPDSWSREQRIHVLSALTALCGSAETTKSLTTLSGEKRTNRNRRLADVSDVPLAPSAMPNKLDKVPNIAFKDGAKCYFTGKPLWPNEVCVYVPVVLLSEAWSEGATGTRGSKERPTSSEVTVLRVMAAFEFSERAEAERQRQYETILALSDTFSHSNMRCPRPQHERAMPIGYDRHGSEFWLLNAQMQMTVADLHEAAKPDEAACIASPEPYLLVKRRNGRWYKLSCSLGTFSQFLQQLDSSIPCERVLQRCAAERISYVRCSLHRGVLLARGVQIDWLQRTSALFEWLSKWTLPSNQAEPKEQMKQFEIYWARLCELRTFVHTYLMFEDKEEKERLRMPHADVSREREFQRKKVAKLRTAWADDLYDAHPFKGFLRSDHIAKIRQLTTTTSATFIHYNFEFYKLYCEHMSKCIEPYAYMQSMHEAQRRDHSEEMEVEADDADAVKADDDADADADVDVDAIKADADADVEADVEADADGAKTDEVPEEVRMEDDEEEGAVIFQSQSQSPKRVYPPSIAGYVSSKKMIEQLHPETGEVLRVYPSGRFASNFMQVSQGGISQCCNGNSQEFCGFKWRFYKGPEIDFALLDPLQKTYDEIMRSVGQLRKYDSSRKPASHGAQTTVAQRPATASLFSGGIQQENPSEPRVHVVLAVETMSSRLVKLKAELLSVLYVAPIRKVKYVDLPPDNPSELEGADKAKRKEMRRARRFRGQALFIDKLRAASTPGEVMRLVKLLECMLPAFVVCHNSNAMPRIDAVTCGEVAANIFALDRALRYDNALFEDKQTSPKMVGSIKTHKPRIAFVPKCLYSFSCTNFHGHVGKCSTFGSPMPSRLMEYTDPARPPAAQVSANPYSYGGAAQSSSSYSSSLYSRPASLGKVVEHLELDVDYLTPLLPPKDIVHKMCV